MPYSDIRCTLRKNNCISDSSTILHGFDRGYLKISLLVIDHAPPFQALSAAF
jgi:hypothetical protein